MAYARGHPNTGGNPATIDYATASSPLGPWTYRGRILDTVANTTTNHAAIVQLGDHWYVVYHTGMAPGGGEFRRSVSIDKLFFEPDGTIRKVDQTLSREAQRPLVRYGFEEAAGDTATDSSGNERHATLVNGAGRLEGRCGNAVALDGLDDHVSMPAGLIWHMYDFTVAAWVNLDPAAPAGSPRVFEFGRNANVNMFLTPQSDSSTVRFGITTTGAGGERRINGTAPLASGEWTHVAVTKSGLVGTLYVDGAAVGQNTNLNLYPARLGNSDGNWIGRAQAAPFLDGEVDDFRVYQRGMSAAEIADLQACEWYLHDQPTPPVGDTTAQANLPLDNTAPVATTLHNYDTDRDAFPGLLIQKGGSGANERDPTKAQAWRFAAPQAGVTLSGDVELTFFASMKDFDSSASARTKRGFVRAFLRDCPPSGACTLVASGSLDQRGWHGGSNAWIERSITFSGVEHTVAAGHFLEVKLSVDRRADDDMWFAYDTLDHPARLIVP
jgi:hypothetical protein